MTLVRFCVIICNAEKVEGCPSGQRGQAVNLVGDGPSEVRILLPPPFGFLPSAFPNRTTSREPSLREVPAKFSSLGGLWWAVQGSNLRPSACKADALPLS